MSNVEVEPLVRKAYTAVRALWEVAAADDFAILAEIPSTGVKAWVDHARTLSSAARERSFELHARLGVSLLLPRVPMLEIISEEERTEWQAHATVVRDFAARSWWSYTGVREGRQLATFLRDAMARGSPPPPGFENLVLLPADWIADTANLVVPKAPELRKLVRAHVASPLGLKVVHDGDWKYQWSAGESSCVLHIDYGSRLSQLRYEIWQPKADEPGFTLVSFEKAIGILSADWDLITADNGVAAMNVLRRITVTLTVLRDDLLVAR